MKGFVMLYEADVALANLDWLILHRNMKLDYAARCVRYANGEPGYLLSDLEITGLTPATESILGRGPATMCTESVAVTSVLAEDSGEPTRVLPRPIIPDE